MRNGAISNLTVFVNKVRWEDGVINQQDIQADARDTSAGGGKGGDKGDDSDCDEPETHFYKKNPKTPALNAKTTISSRTSDYDREQNVNFIDTAMVSIFPALDSNKC